MHVVCSQETVVAADCRDDKRGGGGGGGGGVGGVGGMLWEAGLRGGLGRGGLWLCH